MFHHGFAHLLVLILAAIAIVAVLSRKQ